MSAAESPASDLQQWERYLRSDLESTLQEALLVVRRALESRLQQEINAGMANALHDATPALLQTLQRRVGSWRSQFPPPAPPPDPWPQWLSEILDARQPNQVLQALFSAATAIVPKIAIYVVRGEAAILWKQMGLDAPHKISGDSALAASLHQGRALGWRPELPLAEPLPAGLGRSAQGGLRPILVRGRSIGAVYYEAAAGTGSEAQMTALVRIAALALEQLMAQPTRAGIESITAARPSASGIASPYPARGHVEAPETTRTTSTEARARRFAKVLMQDLELYLKRDRSQDLDDARTQRQVYKRFSEDLRKCRDSYIERFPATSGVGLDVLEQQMVQILCQGDASVLGPEYHGWR